MSGATLFIFVWDPQALRATRGAECEGTDEQARATGTVIYGCRVGTKINSKTWARLKGQDWGATPRDVQRRGQRGCSRSVLGNPSQVGSIRRKEASTDKKNEDPGS